jgi:methionyl-tRNA formyltransferase
VQDVWSNGRGEDLPETVHGWNGDYIFCFRSYFILPSWLISRASQAAINIHPGPPEYRGSGCLNWALYDKVPEYGVTAHFIDEEVDAGRIIAVQRFEVNADDSVSTLLRRTHEYCLNVGFNLAQGIAESGVGYLHLHADSAADEKWGGPLRRMSSVDSLSRVDPTISRRELERVIRATNTHEFPTYVEIQGYRFILDFER